MKTVTTCLQASDIEALLAETVMPTQSQLWEEHFSGCESCRQTMANQVGDQQWWQEAERSLKSESMPLERDSAAIAVEEHESIEELLKLLGPTDDPQMLGRIGSYEVLGVLGRGGMGVVFKAFDAPLNRFVAIKMLLPHLAASGAARKRFAREGQAVAAVVDDHVMAIHCVDEWQGVPYLVMTYSRGVSLQKRLSDNGPLEVREILRIGMQTAKGLAAAHAQGIVHRDIKPANIFLDQTVERVQLMDFGLARAVDDASLTRTGVLAGTPQYMSPEQARAETVDHRSDLFSLGSVMYAMCTGHAPFRAESSYSVLRLITDKEPRPIREINPDIPDWLCAIITKLMAKQASDRYQSAKEFSVLLEDCLAHVQQPAATPLPTAIAALAPTKIRRPPIGKFIAAAAFAFALLFAGVFVVLELNKGTLSIHSDSDGVRVRITQGDEVVDVLKVSKSGQAVRVAAGNYKVEIIGETDDLVVENGQVALHRAGTEVVKIVHNAHSRTEGQASVVPDAAKYFLMLRFYEKRADVVKQLANPTLAIVDGRPFTYTSGGIVDEKFIGCKLNGKVGIFDDSTVQASLQLGKDSDDFEVHAKLKISETKTVQLDEVTWLDLSLEPARTDNTLKLSANKVEVLSGSGKAEVRGTGPFTIKRPAVGSKAPSDLESNERQTKYDLVQEAHPEQADLSTPQATLEYIVLCKIKSPTRVLVDCYTDEALLEMSGVMLQQLGYMSVLSQISSHVDAQVRIQTNDISSGINIGPIVPGALPSFTLQVDALLEEQSLAMPPEQCKKAFELLLKSTVASLDGNQSRVIPDRELYKLAAGVLKSTREFLPKAGELSERFRDSSSEAGSLSNYVLTATQYDIVIHGDEAVATMIIDRNSSATPTRFKLRRVNQRWLVSEAFSDEILTQINLSMPQMTGDVPAIKTEDAEQSSDVSALQPSSTTITTSQPLLNTWEQVQARVAEIVKEREAIANAEVDFKLDSDGKNTSKRHYHVWLDDRHRRADCLGVSSDAAEDYSHIVTPNFSWYEDHLDKSKSQLSRRDPNEPVGWGTLGCIVDVRKIGLINWSIESIDTYEFDHDLLPKDRIETLVETGDYEGTPISIVKHRLKATDTTERWTEYWLSPKHGNHPIYIANGWTESGNQKLKNIVSQRAQWELVDGIWFPRSVKHQYLSEHRKLDETSTFTLIGARFNVLPFPNVFDLSKVDSRESNTNSR